MKLFLALFALVAAANAAALMKNDFQEYAFENEINKIIEKLRKTILEGDAELGVPVLDPLEHEEFMFDLEVPNLASIFLDIKKMKLTGLGGFVVNKMSFNLLRMRLDYSITMPSIKATAADYDLDVTIANEGFKIFGKGAAAVEIQNLDISGAAYISLKSSRISMKDFEIEIKMGAFKSNIEGLMGDAADTINAELETQIPKAIEVYQTVITSFISEKVIEIANKILQRSKMSPMAEFLRQNV